MAISREEIHDIAHSAAKKVVVSEQCKELGVILLNSREVLQTALDMTAHAKRPEDVVSSGIAKDMINLAKELSRDVELPKEEAMRLEVTLASALDSVNKSDYDTAISHILKARRELLDLIFEIVVACECGEIKSTILKPIRVGKGYPLAVEEASRKENPGTHYLEEGERIARQLGNGVIYNGSQIYHDKIYTHFFTDAAVTGTTFSCLDLEECKATLIKSRKDFGAAPPTFEGNPDNGRCYEEAWRFLVKEEEGELVHGSVQTIGKRINHAWVELPTGYVWEPESGEFMKKSSFYERAEPIEEHRYNVEEAAIMLARVGKHGPWTDEERARWLK